MTQPCTSSIGPAEGADLKSHPLTLPGAEETVLCEPVSGPDVALAYSDAIDLPEPRRSRMPAAVFVAAVVALVATVAGWFVTRPAIPARSGPPDLSMAIPASVTAPPSDVPRSDAAPSAALAAALSSTAAELVPPAPPDRFVAMAVSSRNGAIGSGGYGASDSQAKADELALTACKAHTGDELCVVVAQSRNGCVAYAIDGTGAIAAGAGSGEDDARASALARLPGGFIVAVHCATKGR